MKDILNRWMGEILWLIFGVTLVISMTIGVMHSTSTELEMVKQGYIQVQGLGTSKLLWVKEK